MSGESKKEEITVNNVLDLDYMEVSNTLYKMIEHHVDYASMNTEKFVFLLGYYASIFQYFSELYTFLIGKVRDMMEIKDNFRLAKYRDKRDLLEQLLKATKLQYESLSRKITVLTDHDSRGIS